MDMPNTMISKDSVPAVSVIIPTYNRSWGLIRSVESVLTQSFHDFEIIIVDDCSQDDTNEIAASIKDARISYFRQPVNVGVSKNWSKGLELAQGEFVTFLMDDDFYKSDFLTSRVHYLQSDPNLVVAFSSYEMRDLEGNLTGKMTASFENKAILSSEDLLKCALQRNWFIGASMYRRSAVQAVWRRAALDHMVIDFSLGIYLALQAAGNGLYLNTQDFVMSHHPGQNSQAKLKEVLLQVDNALSRILDEFSTHPHARLIRREQSAWKVLQARHVKLQSQNDFEAARDLIFEALYIDIENAWAWKQLLKLLLLNKL